MERKLTTHESDGHTPGTWQWRIDDGEGNMSFDGGWPDEATAREHGEEMLAKMRLEDLAPAHPGATA